jgi:hypothetical protein
MHWNAITAIVASLLFLGAVGKMIDWIFNRPQIQRLSQSTGSWHSTYRDGQNGREMAAAQILLTIKLRNVGKEDTVVAVLFEGVNNTIYQAEEEIEVKWNKKAISATILVTIPVEDGYPSEGERLNGTIILKPRRHRRLCIGIKELREKIDIPYWSGGIHRDVLNRVG